MEAITAITLAITNKNSIDINLISSIRQIRTKKTFNASEIEARKVQSTL